MLNGDGTEVYGIMTSKGLKIVADSARYLEIVTKQKAEGIPIFTEDEIKGLTEEQIQIKIRG